ncbi:unnamed protein product [Cochlearia groenlandica]
MLIYQSSSSAPSSSLLLLQETTKSPMDPLRFFYLRSNNATMTAAEYERIKQDLNEADDEVIIKRYLKTMINYKDSCLENIIEYGDLYSKNPKEVLDSHYGNPIFFSFKPKTESCGRTDLGCKGGCWRIIGRDKVIRSEKAILGFKRILKFCEKDKARECKRSWVMEEYRAKNQWNPKQDHVICKIRLMFQAEISFLLAKQSSRLLIGPDDDRLLVNQMLPEYAHQDYEYYLQILKETNGNKWPAYVTSNVYNVHPTKLVRLLDKEFVAHGMCFYVNKTDKTITDGCEDGCWRIMARDKLIKCKKTGKVIGIGRVYKYCDNDGDMYFFRQGEVKLNWTMEEYRLTKKMKKNKVICIIKVWKRI